MQNPRGRDGRDGGARRPILAHEPAGRRRSFCFLDRQGERWTVFLVTYAGADGRARGYFSFRSASHDDRGDELRTADLFVEHSEAEVDARARGLGRPLLSSLLDSALHTWEQRRGPSPDVRRWFRELLAKQSARLTVPTPPDASPDLDALRTLYDSYRIDQVAHLIALLDAGEFGGLVERVLDGRSIDFHARDRLQLAMIVVQELERRLPLPPFEVWVEDYLARPEVYRVYSHELHREQSLPD